MEKTKIFFDAEFTGLHQNTTLISIGFVSECGKTFYAEFKDFDKHQVNDWIEENVIKKLQVNTEKIGGKMENLDGENWSYYGKTSDIVMALKFWLKQFESIEIWSDCLAYDWVLFNELFGGALKIPKNIYYIPFDISTLFKVNGIDPDVSREGFSGLAGSQKHNALWDAMVIKACYEKLSKK